jgi:hypothetical protein
MWSFHADALTLLKRLQGRLNQAIIAMGDVEEYFVLRRVSFIIAGPPARCSPIGGCDSLIA